MRHRAKSEQLQQQLGAFVEEMPNGGRRASEGLKPEAMTRPTSRGFTPRDGPPPDGNVTPTAWIRGSFHFLHFVTFELFLESVRSRGSRSEGDNRAPASVTFEGDKADAVVVATAAHSL